MCQKGTVKKRTKGFYYLITEQNEEIECKVKGNLFQSSRYDNQIAVGDCVTFTKEANAEVGLITEIGERKSFLSRNRVGKEAEQIIAANVDNLLIVSSTRHPPFRTNLVNRMLVAANVGNISPVLVVTKTDLASEQKVEALVEPYRNLNLDIIPCSIKSEKNYSKIVDVMKNSISVLSGQSGVGKSSLLNRIFPGLSLKVGEISEKTLKGSHTTTFAEMFRVAENGFVIDTPGIREFGLWGITPENLAQFYPGISEFSHECKHRNCHHIHEPDCAVKEAVEFGEFHEKLYQGYISIYNSLKC